MVNNQNTESLYQVLGVEVDATQEELKRAYRRKAARLHPDKAIQENRQQATQEFQQLNHAFGVLSDTEKRKSYDFAQLLDNHSARKKAAYGHQSPEGSLKQLFEEFFGGNSFPSGPSGFTDSTTTYSFQRCWSHQQSSTFFSGTQGVFSSGFQTTSAFSTAAASKDRELPLTLTLEEVLRGGEKDLTINRRLVDGASGRLIPVDEAVAVQLTPGVREGTRIVLRGRGDECPGRGCPDLVLVVREALHPQFERRANDLITCVSVPLLQALTAESIVVPTLGGDPLAVALSGPITPETVLRVPGNGMPVPEEPGRRGDLCVRFRIAFPQSVTPSQKHQLQAALQ